MERDSKILFLDLDDTLLNSRKEITPDNAAALLRVREAGHRIVITTGRPLAATLHVARRLDLDRPGCCIIAFNGALIWDCGAQKAIFQNTLSRPDMIHLYREAMRSGIHVQVYDDNYVISDKECGELIRYSERIGIPYRIDPGLPESLSRESTKILLIEEHDHSRLEDYRARMQEWAGDRLSLFFSNEKLLECVNSGISKGAAVRYMADYYKVPIGNTVSAGDQENDIPMIVAAGVGCAMKNAIPSVKEAADYITERDCEHSGVAEIIEKFIL